jgi:hypothetical protein
MSDFLIDSLRGGLNIVDPAASLPKDACTVANNVEFFNSTLGERRLGCTGIDLPATLVADANMEAVTFLYRHLPTNSESDAELWLLAQKLDGSVGRLFRNTYAGGWSEIAWPTSGIVTDTPVATGLIEMRMQSLHGKLFVAYKSAIDRLHVWDGTTFRRAGLREPDAPTAAEGTAAEYADIVLGDTPLAYWRCNEATPQDLADATGNGLIASYIAFPGETADLTFGIASTIIDGGTALKATAATNHPHKHFVFGTTPITLNGASASLEFWVTPNADSFNRVTNENVMLGFQTDGRASYIHDVSLFEGATSGGLKKLNFAVTGTNNFSTINLVEGTLYHVVYLIAADGTVNLYVNGALDSTFSIAGSNFGLLNFLFRGPSSIGATDDAYVDLFDEVAVYNYQLTPVQILNHYNAGT